MLLMMIYPFAADPLVTVSITILNTIGITTVLLFVLMWRRAASTSDTRATTNQQANGCPRASPGALAAGFFSCSNATKLVGRATERSACASVLSLEGDV